MTGSIRWKLAASYALVVLLSVTLMGALALSFVRRYVERQESEYLRANAKVVALQAQRFIEPQLRRVALEDLASTAAFLGDARVRIMAADRSVLADSGEPNHPDEFLWLIPSGLAEIDTRHRAPAPSIFPVPWRDGKTLPASPREILPLLRDLPLGTSHLYARRTLTPWGRRFVFEEDGERPASESSALPLRHFLKITTPVGGTASPVGWVEMSSPLSLSAEATATMQNAVLFSGIGSLLIALAFGLLMGRALSNPLRALATVAGRMAKGDLSVRAAVGRRDEIGALAAQFNAMAAHLETSFRELSAERDTLKRFIADASHELRTPVTALATFNELLQGSASTDPAARDEFLRESQRQLEKLRWITANLLDLSRLEAGIAALTLGPHDASDILEAAAAGLAAPARDKGLTLRVESCPGLRLRCDRNRLELALSNLIANAVKFAPPGGTVTARASEDGPAAAFTVTDDGPGIPPEDQPHVFERFYRGRNSTADGAGLGLAIVESIAKAHGGSVQLASPAGRGATFTMRIPRGV